MSEGNYSLKEMRTSETYQTYIDLFHKMSEGNYSLKEMRTPFYKIFAKIRKTLVGRKLLSERDENLLVNCYYVL